MKCANGCGQEIRETEPRDGIEMHDGEYEFRWVHEDGNPVCDVMFQASPGGDGYGPVPGQPELHTYMIQQWTMRTRQLLRFPDGERVVAVLESKHAVLTADDWAVTFLVELPGGAP